MKIILALLLAAATLWADEPPITPPEPINPATPWFIVWDSMSRRLWPEAPDNTEIKNGPLDAYYFTPSQAEIDELLAFIKARKEFFPYIPEAWDCDNFAIEAYYLAQVWAVRHTAGQWGPPTVGIAYVKLDGPYPLWDGEPDARGYHAINVILRDDGQWFFFEPQNGRLCPIEGSIYEGAIEVVRILL